jgi:hypothetical protein
MDDHQPEDLRVSTAGLRAGSRGVLRRLFDFNSDDYTWTGFGWRWLLARLGLFVVGSQLGSLLWRIVDPTGDRSFLERLYTNVYIWACLIITAVYAIIERRARRACADDQR